VRFDAVFFFLTTFFAFRGTGYWPFQINTGFYREPYKPAF